MSFGLAYLTSHGIVSVDNSFEAGMDVDFPLDINMFFDYIDLSRSWDAAEDYQEIIRNKNLFYFGISSDLFGNFFLDKRTEANAFVVFAKRTPGRNYPEYVKTEKQVFKFLKKKVKELLEDLNSYESGEVYNYSAYNFGGDLVDTYIGLYGKDFEDTITLMFGGKIFKKFVLKTNFEYISDNVHLGDGVVLDYLKSTFKTNDLDELIDVDFGGFSEIFMKDDILLEFWDYSSKKDEKVKKLWNEMVYSIIENQMETFTV